MLVGLYCGLKFECLASLAGRCLHGLNISKQKFKNLPSIYVVWTPLVREFYHNTDSSGEIRIQLLLPPTTINISVHFRTIYTSAVGKLPFLGRLNCWMKMRTYLVDVIYEVIMYTVYSIKCKY